MVDYGDMLERAEESMGGRKRKKAGRKKKQIGALVGMGLALGVGASVLKTTGDIMKKGVKKLKK